MESNSVTYMHILNGFREKASSAIDGLSLSKSFFQVKGEKEKHFAVSNHS